LRTEVTDVLLKGSKGRDVSKIQQKLKDLGAQLDVDGDFGKGTEEAVKAFQRAHDLDADGIVGDRTWGKLFPGQPMPAGSAAASHPELKPEIAAVVAEVLKQYPQLRITSTTGDHHAANSLHYQGRAADLATGNYQEMDEIGKWIAGKFTGKLAEGIHNPTLSVKNHQAASPQIWGAQTWSAHVNHIHLAV
jgi:peptidoglycan hydrolase-like protein with peptidoglycan-binding domain